MQLLRKCWYPSRSWQGNLPKVDSRDWMLLESISSFIYILFMGAGSLNERRGNDLGVCSKVAARVQHKLCECHYLLRKKRGEFQKPRMLKVY